MQANMEAMEQKMRQMEQLASLKTDTGASSSATMMDVMAVSLKLPSFYEERPESWFYYAESQFRLKKLSLIHI